MENLCFYIFLKIKKINNNKAEFVRYIGHNYKWVN